MDVPLRIKGSVFQQCQWESFSRAQWALDQTLTGKKVSPKGSESGRSSCLLSRTLVYWKCRNCFLSSTLTRVQCHMNNIKTVNYGTCWFLSAINNWWSRVVFLPHFSGILAFPLKDQDVSLVDMAQGRPMFCNQTGMKSSVFWSLNTKNGYNRWTCATLGRWYYKTDNSV